MNVLSVKERRAKVLLARQELENYRGETRKVVVDIGGLTHGEVGKILLGGSWSQLKMLLRYCVGLLVVGLPFPAVKNAVYRWMGMTIGANVYIAPLVYMDVSRPDLICIGDNVMIGMGSAIAVHERNMEFLALGKVRIESGATIGGMSLLRCGVTVGAGAVVEAMSCVVRDLKPGERGDGSRLEVGRQ